jgi:tetratricopeptide (TPR) repeat protein
VSLVCEVCIGVLNRRFVSCHYDAFGGAGGDSAAAAFVRRAEKKSGGSVQYGGIFTPEGELVASFGYDHREFYRALKKALRQHPEYAASTPEEDEILKRATDQPESADALLEAAQLRCERLEFDEARSLLDRVIELGGPASARARFRKGHLVVIDIEAKDKDAATEIFDSIRDVPKDLEDDIAVDRIALRVKVRRTPGFFAGYEFAKGTDCKAVAAELEALIAAAPESNRIGEMHFYLGLARFGQGDRKGADAAWKDGFTKWPSDRCAMLNRLHHTSYVFSPMREGYDPSRVQEPRREEEK